MASHFDAIAEKLAAWYAELSAEEQAYLRRAKTGEKVLGHVIRRHARAVARVAEAAPRKAAIIRGTPGSANAPLPAGQSRVIFPADRNRPPASRVSQAPPVARPVVTPAAAAAEPAADPNLAAEVAAQAAAERRTAPGMPPEIVSAEDPDAARELQAGESRVVYPPGAKLPPKVASAEDGAE